MDFIFDMLESDKKDKENKKDGKKPKSKDVKQRDAMCKPFIISIHYFAGR